MDQQPYMEIAKNFIIEAQGYEQKVYLDTKGNKTIGFGHMVKKGQSFTAINKKQALELLANDLKTAAQSAKNTFGNDFQKFGQYQKAAILDMTYNIGETNLKGFVNFIKSMKQQNYAQASQHLMESKYKLDVKSRSYRNMLIILNDKPYTKTDAERIFTNNHLFERDKSNKIIYPKQIKDSRIKQILPKLVHASKTDQKIAEKLSKLKQTIGGVSFNFDVGRTLYKGFILDQEVVKMIEGNSGENDFSFNDLVVPLKIMYDENILVKNISISLDPENPDNPFGDWYRKVFYPEQLANTEYGEKMVEADYLMKQLSLGVDQNNQTFPYPIRLRQIGLDIGTIFNSLKDLQFRQSMTRLWIVIKDYQLAISEKIIVVKNIRMGVQLKAIQLDQNGRLQDCQENPSPISKRFSEIFTKYYDELCQYFPILSEIKRLAKSSIIAKLLYIKRIPIDSNLVDYLYQKQKVKCSQRVSRLQNKLKKSFTDKQLQMTVIGGCTFDISNLQTKIAEIEEKVKEAQKAINMSLSKELQIKLEKDDNKIGKFYYLNNEKDLISNSNNFPFLFQILVKCKHCDKFCNLDYYSISNRECIDHSSMKCQLCSKLILPGDSYKSNSDKSMIFHSFCFKCKGCAQEIQGPFVSYEDKAYHKECIPKKEVGICDQCNIKIYQTQPYAKNPTNQKIYHAECAKILNQRIQKESPKCKMCKLKLSGQCIKYNQQFYHEQCFNKTK